MSGITAEQHDYLLNNLRSGRVATLEKGGRKFSHLEAWDVKAHLIRVFGFGNFDIETIDVKHAFTRDYMSGEREMKEIAYQATVQLTIRDRDGNYICRFSESSVDSQSGGTAFGDLHDNAIKAATSGALKRCATSLGTQFGLSLYDNGNTRDIVKNVLVRPEGATKGDPDAPQGAAGADMTAEQQAMLESSLGAVPVDEGTQEAPAGEPPADGPKFSSQIDTPEAAAEAVESLTK